MGYLKKKMTVIENGIDTERFKPDSAARRRARAGLQIPEDIKVIGLIGRYDRYKDHENFAGAAGRLIRERNDVVFALCGDGISKKNEGLMSVLAGHGLAESCLLLGRRSDMPALIPAFDIVMSSSSAEAFPVSIVEAMSCGVPCVVTDVGDCARIVGETGLVVPPGNPGALSGAVLRMLSMNGGERALLGVKARERVERYFSIGIIARRHLELFDSVMRD